MLALLLFAAAVPLRCRPAAARAEDVLPVDPALLPAWALLLGVEVDARPLGAELAQARDEAGVAIVVGPVPLDGYAQYQPSRRQVVVSRAIVDEDPRALAAVLTHELMHVKQGLQGLLKSRDCALLEAWAFAFQSDVWWTLTGGAMPTGTALEADLTRIAGLAHRGGVTGLYEALAGEPALGQYCVTDG
jgi:Zn-dependent protease with chaperone function